MPTSQDTKVLNLSGTDGDNDALTFTAFAGNQGSALDQALGLRPGGYQSGGAPDFFENSGGAGEKWLQSRDNVWYFIKPNGDFMRWGGTPNSATGSLVAQLDPVFHKNI